MLRIFKSPQAFSFGLEDRFNEKMARSLNQSGVPCVVKDLWSDFWARNLFFSRIPLGYRLFREWLAPLDCWLHLQEIRSDDIVWINGPSLPIFDTECRFEKKIIRKGARYVLGMEDDWFSDPNMKATAEARVPLADLVIAVTPILCNRIADRYPGKPILLLEEPIDVERLSPPAAFNEPDRPRILWNGRPWNLSMLRSLDGILAKIYRDHPFVLRITTGRGKPDFHPSIPWEWFPFNRAKEAESALGVVAGLAPLDDTPYNRAKGNYKVKTYMAMGIPPLASSVGYNRLLIRHGHTGFLLNTEKEWEEALRQVLRDPALSRTIGKAAREDIKARFSYEALMPIWADQLRRQFPQELHSPKGQELHSPRVMVPSGRSPVWGRDR
jgi:glycosyltransferase involved in cell wall biosynthesis